MNRICWTLLLVFVVLPISTVNADTVVTWMQGDSFDNDRAGDSSAPLLDPVTGFSATMSTIDVFSLGGSDSGRLNSWGSGWLGIQADAPNSVGYFEAGEGWVFSIVDNPALLSSISFIRYTDANDEFRLHADAWVGKGFVPDGVGVIFDSGAGDFVFDTKSDATFSLLVDGGTQLRVHGLPLTLGYTGTGFAGVDSFSFTTVPEPGSVAFLGMLAFAPLLYRRRQQIS